MKMKYMILILHSLMSIKVNAQCFRELLNQTFEHADNTVGMKFPNSESRETISNNDCLEKCLNIHECIGMTYEFDSSTCKLFKFLPNTNIEKEKEIPCQSSCITRYISIPKYCYDISTNIPVYVRFVNQLTDCYAFASLCKSNFKLQGEFEEIKKKFSAIVKNSKDECETIKSKCGSLVSDSQQVSQLENKVNNLENSFKAELSKRDGSIKQIEKNVKQGSQVENKFNNLENYFKAELSKRDESIKQIEKNYKEHHNELNRMLPIGTIIPWSGQTKSKRSLPKGWQSCDGSIINNGPMRGSYTPDLNGKGRFLRGGYVGSSWTYQEDSLENHGHWVEDPGHVHKIDQRKYTGGNDRWCFGKDRWCGWSSDLVAKSRTNIKISGVLAPAKGADETRPKNMVVQFIIKIY